MKKYLWGFVLFIALIIGGAISIIAEVLEFFMGVMLIGLGVLAVVVLYIYAKFKG